MNYIVLKQLEGEPKQKNTLQLDQSKNIKQIQMVDIFMVVFYEGCLIEIFNVEDCTMIQQMDMGSRLEGGVIREVTGFQNHQVIFFSSQTEIRNLCLVSFEDQIWKLLNTCQIEKATQVFNQQFYKIHPDREIRQEEFNIDACWSLLLHGQFKEAYAIIEDNYRYDIRQFLDSFNGESDISNAIVKIKKNMQNISKVTEMSSTKDNELRDDILKFLIKLCTKNRDHYSKYLKNAQQTFSFYFSTFSNKLYKPVEKISENGVISKKSIDNESQNGEVNTTAREILQEIDFNLIKYLIMEKNEKELIQLLSGGANHCQERYGELLDFLRKNLRAEGKFNEILSRFYEFFQNPAQALLLWRENMEGERVSIACDNMIRILKNEQKEKLIFEYLPDIMRALPEKSSHIFRELTPDLYPPSQVKQLIHECKGLTTEIRDNLIGQYYEILTRDYAFRDANIHNTLAQYYVRFLFSKLPKTASSFDLKKQIKPSSYSMSKSQLPPNSDLLEKYTAFDGFLRDPNMLYDTQFVLKLISDSYLQEQTVFLLCKLDRHEQALRLLIDQGEHESAQNECSKDPGKMIPFFFKIYLEKYNETLEDDSTFQQRPSNGSTSSVGGVRKRQRNVFNNRQLFKDYLDDILYTFCYYKDVNPVDILRLVPDNWVLSSARSGESEEANSNDDNNNALFEFLTQSLSQTLQTQRQIRCTRHASESELLQTKIKIIESKRAYVTQYNDRKCAACNKLIVNSTIFVVYPNGVLAHQSCVLNTLHICPETGQDFIQSFNS